MMTGETFVFYLGQVNIDQADWKRKLCHKDSFPADLFVNSGQKLLQPTSNPRYKAIYREAGYCYIHIFILYIFMHLNI
jgi:hypothetical protein